MTHFHNWCWTKVFFVWWFNFLRSLHTEFCPVKHLTLPLLCCNFFYLFDHLFVHLWTLPVCHRLKFVLVLKSFQICCPADNLYSKRQQPSKHNSKRLSVFDSSVGVAHDNYINKLQKLKAWYNTVLVKRKCRFQIQFLGLGRIQHFTLWMMPNRICLLIFCMSVFQAKQNIFRRW